MTDHETTMYEQNHTFDPAQHFSPIEDIRLPFSERLAYAQTNDQRSIIHSCIPIWCGPFHESDYPVQSRSIGQMYHKQSKSLMPFYIARYQVTVWQYSQFVHDNGYSMPEYWSQQGWEWKCQGHEYPSEWRQQTVNNYPITGVSFYEAEAYCRWLSQQGKHKQWLAHHAEIRLPSSIEWEIAACWDQETANMQEWSDTPDHPKQNVREAQVSGPLPVGLFPEGASPCGALDMAGNVWEWCLPTAHPAEHSYQYILRGGCWSTPAERSGWHIHISAEPNKRANTGGFRVLLGQSGPMPNRL